MLGRGFLAGEATEQRVEVEHLGGEVTERLDDEGPQRGVGDDRPGEHLVHQPGELVEGAGGVGGHGHGAERRERQPAHDVRRCGARRDQDQVATTHPGVAEPFHELADPGAGGTEGQRALVGPEPGRAGVPLDGGRQQARDGLGHRDRHHASLSDPLVGSNRGPGRGRGAPMRLDTRGMSLPTTVDGVLARMREIEAQLPGSDGVAVFNAMYLTVTERIGAILTPLAGGASTVFRDPDAMADLDTRFAGLWLTAYDAAAGDSSVPTAWRPLFELRGAGRVPVQYALAGMNTHIEHDLPIAVVATCQARGVEPEALRPDFEAINGVLGQVEAEVRRSFLDQVGRTVDDETGRLGHLISCWSIDKAREVAWVTAETLWSLRDLGPLRDRFLDGLADTVGMTTRTLLIPVP